MEIKNVTCRSGDTALFPDAVTARGRKHIETLIRVQSSGYTACNLYIVQRSDCRTFGPARDIDPEYSEAMERASEEGVVMIACMLEVQPEGIGFKGMLPFRTK